MKNIYSILCMALMMMTVSVIGQTDVYAPALTEPDNEDTGIMPDVLLDWDAVTGIAPEIMYELQLATDSDFTDAVTFDKTDLTALQMSALIFGESYYWHVRAWDNDQVSGWSDTWNFTVLYRPEFTSSTAGGGDFVFANPTIAWKEITGISNIEVQIDTTYSWKLSPDPVVTDQDIYASYILENGNAWAVGKGGLVMFFDGGSWTNVDLGITKDLNDVFFIDENNGYIVGAGKTAYQYDGTNWNSLELDFGSSYNGVAFFDETLGWIVGDGGLVIKFSDNTWTEETVLNGSSAVSTDLTAVDVVNANNAWLTGKTKVIAHYTDEAWAAMEVGTKDFTDISFNDENNGVAVSTKGFLFAYNGTEWTSVETGVTSDLNSVDYSNDMAFIVGDKGVLLSYMDGSITNVGSGMSDFELYDVNVNNAGIAVVVGELGVIIRNSDNSFNSPYLKSFVIEPDQVTYQFVNLLFGRSFYYRVRVIHSSDTSLWSTVECVRTFSNTNLLAPEDNSIIDLVAELEWEEYEGITNYIVEVDVDESFPSPRTYTPGSDSIILDGFVYGQQYYWRVAVQHVLQISDWSEVWSMNTVNSIMLTTPTNAETEVELCPELTWNEVVGSSSYEVWLDSDASFANAEKTDVTEPNKQCTSPLEKGVTYFWKVRGKSGAQMSEWSETWSFTTEGAIGIDEEFNSDAVNIYPNPSNGNFNLYLNSKTNDNYSVNVIDISGRLIQKFAFNCQIGSNYMTFSLDDVESGSYNVVISNGEQRITKRLMVN